MEFGVLAGFRVEMAAVSNHRTLWLGAGRLGGGSDAGERYRDPERRQALLKAFVENEQVRKVLLGEGTETRQTGADDADVHFHQATPPMLVKKGDGANVGSMVRTRETYHQDKFET